MTLIKTKRFFVATQNLEDLSIRLESKGYLQLPDAGTQLTKALIDKERKQFWLVDQSCFENNAMIITNHHKDEVHVLQNDEIDEL